MSDSPLVLSEFSKNRRSSFQVATLSSAGFIEYHKTQPFMLEK
jgi:hypothetical protein